MGRVLRIALLGAVSAVLSTPHDALGQQFGRNKVGYRDFEFKVLETAHFAVFYYPAEEPAAKLAADLAERWYGRFSTLLHHTFTARQPLILYGSHPEFAQTNVVASMLGEGIGGVTESARRRIVMPFAPTLAETDRILGHEIAHAFQFDLTNRHRGGLAWPSWAVEGMAQYLALGAGDAEAVMWLRDAVSFDLLPDRAYEAARKFSPYRYGHTMWAYLSGRFGDRVIEGVLKANRPSNLEKRLQKITGVEFAQLYADFRAAASEAYGPPPRGTEVGSSPLLGGAGAGRLNLGPALSPDGRQAIFFSEKDRLSLDLFLADTSTGRIVRKLATTAASARFDSLQAIRSAGAWSPDGRRFAFGAIEKGQPVLIVLDLAGAGQDETIRFGRFGEIFAPSWSPDGHAIALSALENGATDLYLYDLDTRRLRRLTDDLFGDLHPAWSPDGRSIAFATERFSTDIESMTLGRCDLALVDVESGAVRRVRALDGVRHLNPQWSAGGESLYFISDPDGISNVYRVDLGDGVVSQITRVAGGTTGLTPTSPALSVAARAPAMATTIFRRGKYELAFSSGAALVPSVSPPVPPASDRSASSVPARVSLPPALVRADATLERLLASPVTAAIEPLATRTNAYTPRLFLEGVRQPYLSSGGGAFGTFVVGGGSMLFSDLLGNRKVGVFLQVGNRLRDLALGVRFLNREHRWNWGAVADVLPSLNRFPHARVTEQDGQPALTREVDYFERTQVRGAGYLAYAMSQSRRIEFEAGARQTAYRRTVLSMSRSLATGRVLDQTTTQQSGGASTTVAEASAAFVTDTAVFGPGGPILGSRSRYQVTSTFGELALTRLLLDHRRYFMPVRPYTIATRVVHLGQYGRHADDPRLAPAFLGSRQFVHGYGWSSLQCRVDADGVCGALEDLLGRRLLVGNLELRAPLMGIFSREFRYDPVPAEAFLFADSGIVWSRAASIDARHRITSFGAGMRVYAFGLPLEVAVVRGVDSPARGWSFDFSFRQGF
jgi:Tol biopolymer transport system component